MNNYFVEITDTFGGEANYCWVKRYIATANTIRGAITKAAKETGYNFKKDYGDGEFTRYAGKNALVVAHVYYVDNSDIIPYDYKEI